MDIDDPNLLETIRLARQTSLLHKFAKGGRLTASEFEEIKDKLPPGVVPARASGAVIAPGRPEYKKKLRDYQETYGTRVRAIKGWLAVGRAKLDGAGNPAPDMPPLDDEALMADWWTRCMSNRVPDKLLALALAARQGKTPAPGGASINVATLQTTEGDAMRQARTYLEAAHQRLTAAYIGGVDEQIDRAQRRWEKALAALSSAQSSDRAAAKARGDLISRAEIFTEISTLLEIVRTMSSTMVRRIKLRFQSSLDRALDRARDCAPEELPALKLSVMAELTAEIEAQRSREAGALRQLKVFRSMSEVQLALEVEVAA